MKGYILYDKKGYERNHLFAEALVQRAEQKGVRLEVLIREEIIPSLRDSRLCIVNKNGEELYCDFIINRCIDPLFAEFAEHMGIKLFNSAEVCRICNDKRLTHIHYAPLGIPMANSEFLNRFNKGHTPSQYPRVLKVPEGHGGEQVFWINDETQLSSYDLDERLLQVPVKKLGYDLRVYVMNKKILLSVLRHSERDFRSNFSLGGSAEIYELKKDEEALVQRVINGLPEGAFWVGIDFIFDGDKMLLNEIEDIVGARMIYSKTSIPVHELLVDGIIEQMNKGEL